MTNKTIFPEETHNYTKRNTESYSWSKKPNKNEHKLRFLKCEKLLCRKKMATVMFLGFLSTIGSSHSRYWNGIEVSTMVRYPNGNCVTAN